MRSKTKNKQTEYLKRRLKRSKRRLSLLVRPQTDNHYRPYLVRRIGLVLVALLIVGLQFGYNFSRTGSVMGRASNITAEGLLTHTNESRSANKVAPLKADLALANAARDKAKDMFAKNYWDHNAPDGTEPWVWVDRSGYSYTVAGENLAKNFSTSGAVVAAWMDSPSHRENMLNPDYQDVGFAIDEGQLQGERAVLIVAFYAKPADWKAVGNIQAKDPAPSPPAELSKASTNVRLTPAAQIGIAMQSLSPAALTSLVIIFIALTVAITAHFYRQKLPRQRRESWHRHHGWLKGLILVAIAVAIVILYSGGTI